MAVRDVVVRTLSTTKVIEECSVQEFYAHTRTRVWDLGKPSDSHFGFLRRSLIKFTSFLYILIFILVKSFYVNSFIKILYYVY